MSTREAVVEKVEKFLSAAGMSERQFGIEAVGDHKFLKRLRSGHGVTLTVIEKAERFMEDRPATDPGSPREAACAPQSRTLCASRTPHDRSLCD